MKRLLKPFIYLFFIFLTAIEIHSATYKVRFGDTLSGIARTYKTSQAKLRAMNDLKSNRLVAGQVLKVPYVSRRRIRRGKSRRIRYRVRFGDTLSKIARQFRISTAALARWNKMSKTSVLRAGRVLTLYSRFGKSTRRKRSALKEDSAWKHVYRNSKVLLPKNYAKPKIRKRRFKEKDFIMTLFAQRFARGHAIYVEFKPRKNKSIERPKIALDEKNVPVTNRSWGYRGIMAFSAYRKSWHAKLEVKVGKFKKTYSLAVANRSYPLKVWRRYLGNRDKPKKEVSEAVREKRKAREQARWELIKKSSAKKKEVFALRSRDQLDERTAHPRGYHRVTSKFFTHRKIISFFKKDGKRHYKKPRLVRHRGLDLGGRHGAPIYALADGRVVCARRMYFEGNFTIIDHGNGIFSGYMHQSKIIAKEGSRIEAGQLLGRVGSTGHVTGPHLHVSVWIRGKPVHPLSILGLPIR